jgi:hypothetical protein
VKLLTPYKRELVLLVGLQRQEKSLQKYTIQKSLEEQRKTGVQASLCFHSKVFPPRLFIRRTLLTSFFAASLFISHSPCHNEILRLNLTNYLRKLCLLTTLRSANSVIESVSFGSTTNPVVTEFPVPKQNKKLRDLSRRSNYTDQATAACRRRYYQLLQIEGCLVVKTAVISVF